MVKRLLGSMVMARAVSVLVLLGMVWVPAGAAKKKNAAPEQPQFRATVQPAYTIAAGPLGFSAPGEFYLGARFSLVTLDFLDEDHLLFTFRVPGLMHRAANRQESEGERKIRALVLKLPAGTVDAEAVWTLHDRSPYLYNLGDGKFLLRDRDTLSVGDATLQLTPYLHFPGPVEWVQLDPTGKYLVTGSEESSQKQSKAGDVGSPSTAQAQVVGDPPGQAQDSDLVLRILRRSDGKVMLVSHVHSAVHVPINVDGYVDTLRGRGSAWTLNYNYFSGGTSPVGSFESVCAPLINFISVREFLITGCTSGGEPRVQAMGINGKRLWQLDTGIPAVWPQVVTNASGTRLARETLLTTGAVNAMSPLEAQDIRGQDVQVLDAANGKQVLRAAASPIFDAGGNVAISPSGRRVVILMDGNLQVFQLPAPPPQPDAKADGNVNEAGR